MDDNINKSAKIISKILNSDDFKNAKNVAIYLPIRGEIDISSLVKVKDKSIYILITFVILSVAPSKIDIVLSKSIKPVSNPDIVDLF